MRPEEILKRYYRPEGRLFVKLLIHSRMVATEALRIAHERQLPVDLQFVYEAAMLHDIGIFLTDAPGIYCFGSEPYIKHGLLGAQLLRERGMEAHARVCERHTGAGITIQDIQKQQLPLPLQDYLPETLEEKLICYADKFYSKSSFLFKRKPVERVMLSMQKFGQDSVERFIELHHMFSDTLLPDEAHPLMVCKNG